MLTFAKKQSSLISYREHSSDFQTSLSLFCGDDKEHISVDVGFNFKRVLKTRSHVQKARSSKYSQYQFFVTNDLALQEGTIRTFRGHDSRYLDDESVELGSHFGSVLLENLNIDTGCVSLSFGSKDGRHAIVFSNVQIRAFDILINGESIQNPSMQALLGRSGFFISKNGPIFTLSCSHKITLFNHQLKALEEQDGFNSPLPSMPVTPVGNRPLIIMPRYHVFGPIAYVLRQPFVCQVSAMQQDYKPTLAHYQPCPVSPAQRYPSFWGGSRFSWPQSGRYYPHATLAQAQYHPWHHVAPGNAEYFQTHRRHSFPLMNVNLPRNVRMATFSQSSIDCGSTQASCAPRASRVLTETLPQDAMVEPPHSDAGPPIIPKFASLRSPFPFSSQEDKIWTPTNEEFEKLGSGQWRNRAFTI